MTKFFDNSVQEELLNKADKMIFVHRTHDKSIKEEKIMKTFEELYEMYTNRNENIYTELFAGVDFEELYRECDKDIAKYYEFKCWLEYSEEYYNAENADFLEEV